MKNALIISLLCLSVVCRSQETKKTWYRYPAISPDGSTIAFTSHGDIWLVNSEGGNANRLTTHSAYDAQPVWSGDGKFLAFASNRYGNFDVFLVPSVGGVPKRLTFHSAHDWPYAFTNDNQSVYFSSVRRDNSESLVFHDFAELYKVNVSGDRPELIIAQSFRNISLNEQGDMLFEVVKGYEDEFRKHHQSSVARDIWFKESASDSIVQMTFFKGEDRNAVFSADSSFYYLSEESGSFNIHKKSMGSGNSVPITDFSPHPVRYLSSSDDDLLCFSYNGTIFTVREGEEPVKVNIKAAGDNPSLSQKLLPVGNGFSEVAISPNGKELAFIHRGEVFVSTLEGNLTRRITDTPEQERSLSFSPDGKQLVYAGERDNRWNLYLSSVSDEDKFFSTALDINEKVLLASDKETFQPMFSPDGKYVAFLEERTRLKKIKIESGEVTSIHDGSNNFSYADGDQYFQWSPDSKWFIIDFDPKGYWVGEVGIIKSDGTGEIINLTKSGFVDTYGQWSNEGDVLYWISDRHGGHSVAKTGSFEMDVYAFFLNKKAYDQ
jgi:Tol biopolymer transport system component